MPNHTANNVTITGPKDTVLAFTTMAKNTSQDFSLNSFLPIPSELKNTTSPVHIMSQSEIDDMWTEWRKKKESKCDTGPMGLHSYEKDAPFGLGITQETYYTLVKKYGVSNWYDWCLINWGTKWDCYNVGEWGVDSETSAATIYYETAWSPITIFWQTISQKYPDCEFRHEFADEGGGFLGKKHTEESIKKIVEGVKKFRESNPNHFETYKEKLKESNNSGEQSTGQNQVFEFQML